MIYFALLLAVGIALLSLIGILFFGNTLQTTGIQKFTIPVAVGVFLSLIFFELLPETFSASPEYGGAVVVLSFIGFYILANTLHTKYHQNNEEGCDQKSAAILLLIGDTIHNVADGIVLGGAFLIDPHIGVVTAVGLALHEIPQEIVEFGVLIQAGFSRYTAAIYNLLSASSIILGTISIFIIAEHGHEYIWVLTAIAAGNLLFLATSDLLPRIHGNLKKYGSIWHSASSITLGFLCMTIILLWTHGHFAHTHSHTLQEHNTIHHQE